MSKPFSCPAGHTGSLVVDSRQEGNVRRRRYECRECQQRFTTYELSAEEHERLLSVRVNVTAIRLAIEALRTVEKAVD